MRRLLVTVLLLTVVQDHDAVAQAPTTVRDSTPRAVWGTLGVGPARRKAANVDFITLQASLSREVRPDWLLTGRVHVLEEFCILGCMGPEAERLVALGLLYGPVVQTRWTEFAISGGLSLLAGRRYDRTVSTIDHGAPERRVATIGIPIDMQLYLRPFRMLGVGGGVHLDINPQATYASFSVGVQMGRFARTPGP